MDFFLTVLFFIISLFYLCPQITFLSSNAKRVPFMEKMANCHMAVVQFILRIPCTYNLNFTPMHLRHPCPPLSPFISDFSCFCMTWYHWKYWMRHWIFDYHHLFDVTPKLCISWITCCINLNLDSCITLPRNCK